MGLTTLYFDDAGAGSATGADWANRAPLFVSSDWNVLIRGHDFSANALLCYIKGGVTYTVPDLLLTADFTTAAPTNANPLTFHGCASGGNPLVPADPGWNSCEPDWDHTGLPKFYRSGNYMFNFTWGTFRHIAFEVDNYNNGLMLTTSGIVDWCWAKCGGTGGASAFTISAARISNSIFIGDAATYNYVVNITTVADNIRVYNTGGGTGGNRDLVRHSSTTARVTRVCAFNGVGKGLAFASTSAGFTGEFLHSVFADNTGDGIDLPSTAAQTSQALIGSCMITGNANGIDANSQCYAYIMDSRLRDNSVDIANLPSSVPSTYDNDLSAGTDTNEYVDPDNATMSLRNYTIKAGSAIHGKGYGVADQATAGGGQHFSVSIV